MAFQFPVASWLSNHAVRSCFAELLINLFNDFSSSQLLDCRAWLRKVMCSNVRSLIHGCLRNTVCFGIVAVAAAVSADATVSASSSILWISAILSFRQEETNVEANASFTCSPFNASKFQGCWLPAFFCLGIFTSNSTTTGKWCVCNPKVRSL